MNELFKILHSNKKGWSLLNRKLEINQAVVQRCSVKKVFLEIWQNSKENTCARVFFLLKNSTRTLTTTSKVNIDAPSKGAPPLTSMQPAKQKFMQLTLYCIMSQNSQIPVTYPGRLGARYTGLGAQTLAPKKGFLTSFSSVAIQQRNTSKKSKWLRRQKINGRRRIERRVFIHLNNT